MAGSPLFARIPRRTLLAFACLACLCAAAVVSSVQATPGVAHGQSQSDPQEVPGELVVSFKPEATDRQQRKAVNKVDGEIEDEIESIDGALVSVDPDETDEAAAELSRHRAVRYVEPNYVVRANRIPNDHLFGDQWAMRNIAQYGGKAGADMRAVEAWDVTTGANVTVAVVDTGVEISHQDIAPNLWTNPADPANGADDDHNGFVDDVHGADFVDEDSNPTDDAGHGTHVAGIIGAKGNNGAGVAGVNWDAKIIALKFLDEDGQGNTADAANAIDYAVSHGARVINASWGGPAFSQALYSAVRRAGEKGVVFVAAAGNDGENADAKPDYPAAFDLGNVISVAATDPGDELADFSNYGAVSVDLAAPGEDIESTVPADVDDSGYAAFSGTSMAAPFVTGSVALYLSRFPQGTADQARTSILGTVDKLPSLAGKTVTGGRLNLARALGVNPAPGAAPAVDRTPPSAFSLLRPSNRRHLRRHKLRFVWQRARDAGGIKYYRLYVNGRVRRTIKDKDGPGGKDPKPRVKLRIRGGKSRWYVRAWDYAGNRRTSRTFRKGRYTRSSVLFIKKHRSKR